MNILSSTAGWTSKTFFENDYRMCYCIYVYGWIPWFSRSLIMWARLLVRTGFILILVWLLDDLKGGFFVIIGIWVSPLMFASFACLEIEDITYFLGEFELFIWFFTDFSSRIMPLSMWVVCLYCNLPYTFFTLSEIVPINGWLWGIWIWAIVCAIS